MDRQIHGPGSLYNVTKLEENATLYVRLMFALECIQGCTLSVVDNQLVIMSPEWP